MTLVPIRDNSWLKIIKQICGTQDYSISSWISEDLANQLLSYSKKISENYFKSSLTDFEIVPTHVSVSP